MRKSSLILKIKTNFPPTGVRGTVIAFQKFVGVALVFVVH
jgi:hypothetical protein